jgi:hypothetical protein
MKPFPFVGVPLYSPYGMHWRTSGLRAEGAMKRGADGKFIRARGLAGSVSQCSLLPNSFNALLVAALNMRKAHGITHLAMLHGDIVPQEYWLDTLLEEMEATGVDAISAVVPIKTHEGLTSTAIGRTEGGRLKWNRLTMKDVFGLPETFTINDTPYQDRMLLINTGCLLIDLGKPWVMDWVHGGGFRFETWIDEVEPGEFKATTAPEDWLMSYDIARLGGTVAATRKVGLSHLGDFNYTNRVVWGTAASEIKDLEAVA